MRYFVLLAWSCVSSFPSSQAQYYRPEPYPEYGPGPSRPSPSSQPQPQPEFEPEPEPEFNQDELDLNLEELLGFDDSFSGEDTAPPTPTAEEGNVLAFPQMPFFFGFVTHMKGTSLLSRDSASSGGSGNEVVPTPEPEPEIMDGYPYVMDGMWGGLQIMDGVDTYTQYNDAGGSDTTLPSSTSTDGDEYVRCSPEECAQLPFPEDYHICPNGSQHPRECISLSSGSDACGWHRDPGYCMSESVVDDPPPPILT